MKRLNREPYFMNRHAVYDGIDLVFIEVDQEQVSFHSRCGVKNFAINHCQESRIELTFASGEYSI